MNKRTRRAGSYSDAILWIAQNDDTEWLTDPDAGDSASVTLCLVADVFGRSIEEATEDLKRALKRERRAESQEAA